MFDKDEFFVNLFRAWKGGKTCDAHSKHLGLQFGFDKKKSVCIWQVFPRKIKITDEQATALNNLGFAEGDKKRTYFFIENKFIDNGDTLRKMIDISGQIFLEIFRVNPEEKIYLEFYG